MSVFDVPELATLIGSYLPTHALLHCVRVNMAWHALFTPMLWKSFPPTPPKDLPRPALKNNITTPTTMTVALSKVLQRVKELVKEDYLHTTHQQQQQQQQYKEQHQHADLLQIPGRLSKNGRWIQHLDLNQVFLSKNPPQAPFFGPIQRIPPRTLAQVCSYRHPITRITSASTPPPKAPLSGTRMGTLTATEQDLVLHLLRQCTHLQSLRFTGTEFGEKDVACWNQIMMTRTSSSSSSCSSSISSNGGSGDIELLSTLRDLSIDLSSDASFGESRVAALVFGRCFPRLRRLRFHITSYTNILQPWVVMGLWRVKEELDQDPLLALKELSVTCMPQDNYPEFWPRFLSRCVNLTSLHVTIIDGTWIQQLQAMVHLDSLQIHEVSALDLDLLTDAFNSGTLPRLQSIHIAIYGAGLPEGGDADIAEMLKAGSSGWRSVNLPGVEALAVEVLMEHYLTLEHLSLRRCRGLTSAHIQQFLASCPRLVTFSTLEEDTYEFHEKSNISAQDLIDLDTPLDFLKSANPPAVSPPLKSWKCESTLKVFRVMVTGIPRPDVRELYFLGTIPDRNVLLESYPGQSLDLQRRVYERLARFTNLERLELGNNGFTYNPPSILSNATLTMALDHQLASDIFRENEGFHDYQNHCLAMNLQSGLGLLEGLKQIKEVRLIRMLTDIREVDVAWMMKHWPRLEFLGGLNVEIYGLCVQMWIEENYPNLQTQLVFLD